MLRILLVDDHDAVRRGVQKILREALGETRFGEARNASEALELSGRQPWDLVVLDVSLPDRCGLDIVKELRRRRPAAPVLVLSVHSEAPYASVALKFGARGYVTKQSAAEELVDAVRQVLSGGQYITPALAEKMALHLNGQSDAPLHETLSKREFEVLLCLASGLDLEGAAARMSLSPQAVSAYRARILRKLKMNTEPELAQYAVRHGLLEPENPPFRQAERTR